MSPLRRAVESVHLATLGLWLGILIATGAAAALVFPAMKALDPALPAYAAFDRPHWTLAAGHVAERYFRASDVAQVALAGIAWLTLPIAAAVFGLRRGLPIVRIGLVGALSVSLAWQLLSLRPRMDLHLSAYRAAAIAGESELAEEERAAFAALHPAASSVMAINAALVLLAFAAGAFDATRQRRDDDAPEDADEETDQGA
ncbi:MAG: hypothetical protein KIS87_04570 [Phycisphaeraceae bacterium]|nr:hypothetical protein [Phycisphaeraceae bacterium]